MEDDEDRELEHYVWQHKHEPLRKIQSGMLKEKGRTKSTKWISKIRRQARQAAETTEVEVVLPKDEEIKETTEEKDETLRDEEIKSEDDPEIIETDKQLSDIRLQRKRVEKKTELEREKTKLALAKVGRQKVEDLVEDFKGLKILMECDRKFIELLKQKLEEALELTPNYYPDARCQECDGRFLWRVHGKFLKCYVCGRDYKLETD